MIVLAILENCTRESKKLPYNGTFPISEAIIEFDPEGIVIIYLFLYYRCRVRLLSVEMEGTFGRVYRGSYHEEGVSSPKDVLVKTAAEHASQSQVSQFCWNNSHKGRIARYKNQIFTFVCTFVAPLKSRVISRMLQRDKNIGAISPPKCGSTHPHTRYFFLPKRWLSFYEKVWLSTGSVIRRCFQSSVSPSRTEAHLSCYIRIRDTET
jgi:hypothetical protein